MRVCVCVRPTQYINFTLFFTFRSSSLSEMNQQETELLDSFDRLSLSSLSKSSPSTFTLKPSRLLSTSSNKRKCPRKPDRKACIHVFCIL